MNEKLQGFTLIEIMLVIGLFAMLVIAVNLSVKTTRRAEEIVDSKSQTSQAFRATFGILERDLRSAYFVTAEDFIWNPRQINPEDPNQPPTPLAIKPNPITIFQGKETSLFFNARTHQRISANAYEDEEDFVFYELKNNQLIRSESRHAITLDDREHNDEYRTFVLVEKVTSLKFSFWDLKAQHYISEWDSEKVETLNKVPPAVKIEIKFIPDYDLDTGKKEAKELTLVTAIRLPEAEFRNIDWSSSSSVPPNPALTTGGGTTTGPTQ